MSSKNSNSFGSLMNVGEATLKDLERLNIRTLDELANSCPDELYLRLNQIADEKHDVCVWDIFAAIISEAKTGRKATWWEWTKVRKQRQREGTFCI